MSETLREKQSRFMRLLPRLIDFIYAAGYECSAGELYRTPEQAALNAKSGKGISSSLHTKRLAIDIQLFHGGTYLSLSTDYAFAGTFWKSLDTDCCWGGDFKSRPDGNHFSIEHEGVR